MSAPPITTSFPTGSIVANTNLTAVVTTCTFSSPECAFFFCGTQHQNVTYDEQTQTASCGINQYVASRTWGANYTKPCCDNSTMTCPIPSLASSAESSWELRWLLGSGRGGKGMGMLVVMVLLQAAWSFGSG
ncbi:hypothetical protein JCM24511_07412 [Saitozyma sp. JCM 24511]|nr:hypothetical protein JCM24511_07412 [Saitozyma sp. JCM 24511]